MTAFAWSYGIEPDRMTVAERTRPLACAVNITLRVAKCCKLTYKMISSRQLAACNWRRLGSDKKPLKNNQVWMKAFDVST